MLEGILMQTILKSEIRTTNWEHFKYVYSAAITTNLQKTGVPSGFWTVSSDENASKMEAGQCTPFWDICLTGINLFEKAKYKYIHSKFTTTVSTHYVNSSGVTVDKPTSCKLQSEKSLLSPAPRSRSGLHSGICLWQSWNMEALKCWISGAVHGTGTWGSALYTLLKASTPGRTLPGGR